MHPSCAMPRQRSLRALPNRPFERRLCFGRCRKSRRWCWCSRYLSFHLCADLAVAHLQFGGWNRTRGLQGPRLSDARTESPWYSAYLCDSGPGCSNWWSRCEPSDGVYPPNDLLSSEDCRWNSVAYYDMTITHWCSRGSDSSSSRWFEKLRPYPSESIVLSSTVGDSHGSLRRLEPRHHHCIGTRWHHYCHLCWKG